MRVLLPVVMLAATLAVAQQPKTYKLPPAPKASAELSEKRVPVSHSDLYCAGRLARELPKKLGTVAGGSNSPAATEYVNGDLVFLRGSFQPGTRVSFVRVSKDPNKMQVFSGQHKAIAAAGHYLNDLGYAVVVEDRGKNISVAKMELSCEPTTPGDMVVPFVERAEVSYRISTKLNEFPLGKSPLEGRILLAHNFDSYVGTSQKVYLDIGWAKGLKVGDHLRVVTGFTGESMDEADRVSLHTATIHDDTQVSPKEDKEVDLATLPRKVTGELVVLSTEQNSATAMVTFAVGQVHVGDHVEIEQQ